MPFNRGFPDRKAHTCRRTLNQPCGFGMLGVIEIGLFAQGGNDGQQGFSLPVTQRFVDDRPVRKLLSPHIETVSFDLQKAARDKFENIVLKRLSITASELDQIFFNCAKDGRLLGIPAMGRVETAQFAPLRDDDVYG